MKSYKITVPLISKIIVRSHK